MELKVWCDGIQRVVCGVSSSTTCQDVVFALAHATGQTGRFILIEKWRNNERLLAPIEQPLNVLSKWGEYANDVTFVMKRSDSNNKNQNNCNNSSFNKSINETTSPSTGSNGSGFGNSPQKKDHKKSPLFSSASSSTMKSLSNTSTTTTTTTHSTTTPNKSPQKSNSCLTSSQKTDSNNSTPTKPQTQQLNNTNNNNNNEISSPSKSLTSRPRHPPPYSEAISKSAMISNTNTTSSHNSQNQSLDERSNKRRSLEPSLQTHKQRTNCQKEQSIHRDAVRLVDMQKETMKNQEKDMLNLEQQIGTIEIKLSENETIIKRYKEEMENVHQLWLDQEVMIDKLDQQRLDQELDELVTKAKNYEEEVVIMKKKLSNCEGDIADCRQKIAKLMDKLEESEKSAKLNELEKEDNDRLMTDQLKIAVRDKSRELDSQKCELQTLSNSVTHLDSVLHEKNTQIDKLMNDLKEANIEGLALQPAEDVSKMAKQPFHQRSGSTRRIIGSPRELENAVVTNKNPHGVWV